MNEFVKAAGFFLLGVLTTICVMFVAKEITKEGQLQANAIVETVMEEAETVSVMETSTYDYEAEAEERINALQLKEETVEAETETEMESTENLSVSANSIEAAKVKWKKEYPVSNATGTLEENQNIRSSYEETLATNAFDKKIIENNTIDFSNVKIAILGDSITLGSNMSEEDREKYSIPVQLQKILGAKEVYNLAVGGSTISRASDSYPMVDRWAKIPMDTDIIIVFGGTNDSLFENKWDYGFIEYDKRMTKGTFCGDLDEMLGGIKYSYREHNLDSYIKFLIVNPPSTILQDAVYNRDPNNMIHQKEFAQAISEISPAYGFEVIDMYNNNLFNSHDERVNKTWITDGVHGNAEAYEMMAQHLASQIIQRIDQ